MPVNDVTEIKSRFRIYHLIGDGNAFSRLVTTPMTAMPITSLTPLESRELGEVSFKMTASLFKVRNPHFYSTDRILLFQLTLKL